MRRGAAAAPRTLSHSQPQQKQKTADPAPGGPGLAGWEPAVTSPPETAPPPEPLEPSEAVAKTSVLFRKMKNTLFSLYFFFHEKAPLHFVDA